jgi:AcrR family transcriptional regulator
VATATIVRTAALSLFAERGYHATTLADIGAAVEIRGFTLYRHVHSKQDLLADIMTGAMNHLLALQTVARPPEAIPRSGRDAWSGHTSGSTPVTGNRPSLATTRSTASSPTTGNRRSACARRSEHGLGEGIDRGLANLVL